MEWLVALVAVAGAGVSMKVWRNHRQLGTTRREELDGVRRLADDDVTVLGEQLRRLDAEVAGHELDEVTRADYQTALDAYESAQRAVPRLRSTDEISKITDTLSTGRYALACVQARVAGRPVPELRAPCFFNPQHGPSAGDVMWTQPGRGTRKVPACAQDAARIANAEPPDVRMVSIGSRRVPYWEAGAAYQPYGDSYFTGAVMMTFQQWGGGGHGSVGGHHGGHGGHGGFDGGHAGGHGGSHGGGADGGGGF